MTRSVPEWVGATPDTPVPPRVKLRVFERFGGVCQETGRKIAAGEKWECDHTLAIILGGENRESNLRPVLAEAHRAKTKTDAATKSKIASVRKKHLGLHKAKAVIPGSRASNMKRKLNGETVRRDE